MGVVMSLKDPNYIPLPFPPGEQGGRDPTGGAIQACVNVKSLYKLVRMCECDGILPGFDVVVALLIVLLFERKGGGGGGGGG